MRRGFTLIELLVVVAVIAILMAILLPSLQAAREQSRSVACQSNLRQMAMMAYIYAENYDGLFPIAWDMQSEWDFQKVKVGTEYIMEPGILWMGQTNMKVQQCPSYTGKSGTLSDPYTGYNYNTSYIGHGVGEEQERPAKVVEVAFPALTALFGDAEFYTGKTNKYMRSPLLYPASPDKANAMMRAAGTQSFRHRDKTNVVFADGHGESLAERHTAGTALIINSTAYTGFLSADNSLYGGSH